MIEERSYIRILRVNQIDFFSFRRKEVRHVFNNYLADI